MLVNISGKEFSFTDQIRDVPDLRQSFFELARQVFGLDFEPWYQEGYWNEDYRPFVLAYGERVVSCVAVNDIRTRINGADKRFIQLGTVMTHPDCRGQGLARFLMERVLEETADADGVYLFANDSVLDFYPKFGFRPEGEAQCRTVVSPRKGCVRQLDMDSPTDREILLSHYLQKNNPYSSFPMLGNTGLLMFYCANFWKENVYLLEDFDTAAIAFPEGEQFICCELFGDGKVPLTELLGILAGHFSLDKAALGFPPMEKLPLFPYKEEDSTLFVLEGKENPCQMGDMLFPFLSHA
ncbi:MAG TPA: GNAT family N-acetyltransferase [Candidatus Merdivicinus excrementipullorum]|uniref:GNAT family N-acetyltransferase n=1 Tax=Candidatus Merdivicinus excrementipullorum TaxID=2840867 RepID=A0A9D1FLX1_9FIRM|nr:GNAT family N-acetyltransferase [Candidatus Merdivicinus excrementipullorum]